MSGTEPIPPTQDQLLQEAATWFARMRGPDAEASRAEFEAWLRRGALHRQAYNRASEIFAMGKILAEDSEPSPPEPSQEVRRRGRMTVAWAFGALLALIAAGWFVLQRNGFDSNPNDPIADGGSSLPPAEILSTTAAGQRTLRLADGSLVVLEADSLVEVRLGPSERRLDLRRGQGRFRVFHDRRPFVVHAGGGQVVARGTIFDVGYAADRRVTVRLIEGIVDVTYPAQSAPGGPAASTRRLRPGQALSYGIADGQEARTLPPAASRDAHRPGAASAPQAARDFDGIALAELIAAANRGSALPIRLASPALGERRVSGRFRIDDTMLLAERLALLFDLDIHRGTDVIVLRTR